MIKNCGRILLATVVGTAGLTVGYASGVTPQQLEEGRATAESHWKDGLWKGTFDINGRGEYHYTGLYMNGRIVGHSSDAKVIYRGGTSVEGENYRSELEMFFFRKGQPFDKATLEGVFVEPEQIKARFLTHGAGDTGDLNLRRDESSDRKASFDLIAGSWILYRGFNILKLEVSETGIVKGGNTSGCAYDGKIEPIGSEYNAYEARLVVTSCNNTDGVWQGMGYLSDGIAANDTLNLHLFEKDWAMLLPIVRNEDTRLIDERKDWTP